MMMINDRNNFIGYSRSYYRVVGNKLLFAVFLSIMVGVLDGLGLAMLMPLLQSVVVGQQNAKESMGNLHYITDIITNVGFSLTLGPVLMTLAILFLIKGVVKYSEINYHANVVQFFMKKVRHGLVDSLKNVSYKGFTQLEAGNIQNSFIAEVNKMSHAIRSYLAYCQSLFMLMTYVLFALLANYQFAVLLAISAGLTNILYSRFYKLMKEASYEVSKKGNSFNSFMIQAVLYFKYLKSTNYLDIYTRKLSEVIDNTEAINKKMAYYNAVSTGVREPMIILIVISVIYMQVNWMGGNLGSIILSLMLFYRALNFLVVSQQSWQAFIQNTGAISNVSKISAIMNSMSEEQGELEFNSLKQDISVSDACLSYGGNAILDQVNISIPKRKTIAFVGESGAGKTTLVNIIMGLVNPDQGAVMIDGIPLTQYNLKSYRSKIGYISQDPVVFNDNIFNNVTFWAEPTSENYTRFWQVIKLVSLKEFVECQTAKELTNLGDNGIKISGGQKQRISIARELFKNVDILILDEATSALDSETELMIQENIEKLHGHYTMVVIAHRLSTIKNVDKIYLIERGKVVKSGSFESMVQNSDKFKRMVALQGL